jgi:hypothetical protein
MAINFQPKEVTDKSTKDLVVKKAGASEYLIFPANSQRIPVTVASINSTTDYCNPKE